MVCLTVPLFMCSVIAFLWFLYGVNIFFIRYNSIEVLKHFAGKNCCFNTSRVDFYLEYEPHPSSAKNINHLFQSKCCETVKVAYLRFPFSTFSLPFLCKINLKSSLLSPQVHLYLPIVELSKLKMKECYEGVKIYRFFAELTLCLYF